MRAEWIAVSMLRGMTLGWWAVVACGLPWLALDPTWDDVAGWALMVGFGLCGTFGVRRARAELEAGKER